MTPEQVQFLVVHCSATPANRDIGVAEVRAMHKKQGWRDVGYHYVIRRDGRVEKGRPDSEPGAHVQGYNSKSLGVCLVGGVKPDMSAECNFTAEQFRALRTLLNNLKVTHPHAQVCGHRDLSPDRNHDGRITPTEWMKECPSFDVADFLRDYGL